MDSSTTKLEDAIELRDVVQVESNDENENASTSKLSKAPGKIAMPELPRDFMSPSSLPSTPGNGLNTPSLGPYTPSSARTSTFFFNTESPTNAANAIAALPPQDTGYCWTFLAAAAACMILLISCGAVADSPLAIAQRGPRPSAQVRPTLMHRDFVYS